MVNWSQQQTANGIITGYEVIATPITTVGLDSPNGTIQSSLLNIEVCAHYIHTSCCMFYTCTPLFQIVSNSRTYCRGG